jgi:hypothetical protein
VNDATTKIKEIRRPTHRAESGVCLYPLYANIDPGFASVEGCYCCTGPCEGAAKRSRNSKEIEMIKSELQIGQIMQLNPDTVRNRMFAGCLMTVTEPKSWGAQGYVQSLGEDEHAGGQAYYRATWEEMEPTGGIAEWVAA